MKIVHISDTHNRHNKITIPECDLLIHSGDFSGMGFHSEVKSFLKWFTRQPSTYKIFISGNHDISFDPSKSEDGQKPEWLRELLEDYLKYDALNFYLENSSCEIEGITFYGSPITPTFGRPIWAFNKDRGWDIRQIWNEIPEYTNVLITHGPPWGFLDLVPDYETTNGYLRPGGHKGCADLIDRIEWVRPQYHLFGHIHEGYGSETHKQGDIKFFNGSIVNMQYEATNKPHIFEI